VTVFLNEAINILSTRPQSIDEVAEANGKHHQFEGVKPKVIHN
jgi:hypothetical protein